MHVFVENQLAMGFEPSVQALARLLKEGLDRHEVIHASTSVAAGLIYQMLKDKRQSDSKELAQELSQLTAEKSLNSGIEQGERKGKDRK